MLPDIIFITDSKRVDPFSVCKKLPAGSIVILRDYELSDSKRLELAKKLQKTCKAKKLKLLIARTPEIAVKIKADGVHLPEFMANAARKLKAKHPKWLLTAAAHSRKAAFQAFFHQADAILLSPIFVTPSHPEAKPLGLHRAKKMQIRGVKTYALGGITLKKLKILKTINFQGIASVSGLK